jgi:aminopeptidase YwaD
MTPVRVLTTLLIAGALALVPSSAAAGWGMPAIAETAAKGGPTAYEAAIHISGPIGSRPAGSRGERRAHSYVAKRFEAAGLDVEVARFSVPGRGRSRNVIGKLETSAAPGREAEEAAPDGDCLQILMAHTDSVPPGPGANDNASGVGVLVALAPKLAKLDPGCDVWLVATGAEERVVIGTSYHVGAAALVRTVKNQGRGGDLRHAISVDMVGRGKRFYLRSPQSSTRPGVEGEVLSAARRANVTVRWARDSGDGNSDHREFELAGLPAAVIEVWRGEDACHHEGCDRPGRLQKGALNRALRVSQELVSG